MNDRIKELAEQANMMFNGTDLSGSIGRVECYEDELEKFAELIATECLDLLWNSLSISADHDGTVDGIEYTGKEILTAVKEHFGVE